MLETILELNWNQCLGDEKIKLNICCVYMALSRSLAVEMQP